MWTTDNQALGKFTGIHNASAWRIGNWMKNLIKWLAWAAGAIVLLVVLAVVLVPMLVNPNNFKGEIATAVKEATGRDLQIEGDLGMTVFPWLGVTVGKVSLGNAPGFSDVPFAATERVEVRVKLQPLLFEQRLVMDTVTVHGLSVNLEKNAKGKSNWDDLAGGPKSTSSDTPSQGGGLAALSLGGLDIRDASLSLRDAAAAQSVELTNLTLGTGAIGSGQPVSVNGAVDLKLGNPAIAGKVELETVLNVSGGGHKIDARALVVSVNLTGPTLPGGKLAAKLGANLSADLKAGKASVKDLTLAVGELSASGGLDVTNLSSAPNVDGKLALAPFDLKKLLASLGLEAPVTADANALTAVSLNTDISASATQAGFKNLKLKLDDTSVTGSVSVADFSRQALRFDLGVDKIDVDRYLPPQSKEATAATPGAGASAIDPAPLRALDIQGKLTIADLTAAKAHVSSILVKVVAKGGVVRLAPVSAKLYKGEYAGKIVLNAKGNALALTLDEKLSGVHLSPLLKDLQGKDRLSGVASANIKASTSGNDPAAMKKALKGAGNFKFTNGAIKGVNVAAMIREAKAQAFGGSADVSNEPQKTDFSEMGGTFQIRKGVVANKDFLAKSPLLRVTGKGNASLVTEAIAYQSTISVVATSKGQGGKELGDLAGLDVPVKIGGTFAQPSYGLDFDALVKSIATSKLKDVVSGGTGAVTSAVKDKLGGALSGALGGAKSSGTSTSSAPKTDSAAGAVKALKSIFD
jgi:AsmA protein